MAQRALVSLLAGLVLAACHGNSTPAGPPHPVVVMKTSLGEITLELDRTKAPATVDNFLRYVNEQFYDGTVFHRVIDGFMIQGGGLDRDMREKETHGPIPNESQNGLKNQLGTIAMARQPSPNSATAQFFINVASNEALNYPNNGGYAVFGKVTSGMDVVDRIRAVPTRSLPSGLSNVPAVPVIIESVRLK
jgi:peptidyl-prolyl cis-trans isomerase A (cyclophilin A)